MDRNTIFSRTFDLNETIKDDDMVSLINTLSDSLRQYYKVTKNVNKNESILINSCIKETSNAESIINNFIKEGITNNNINLYNNMIMFFSVYFMDIFIHLIFTNIYYIFTLCKIICIKITNN